MKYMCVSLSPPFISTSFLGKSYLPWSFISQKHSQVDEAAKKDEMSGQEQLCLPHGCWAANTYEGIHIENPFVVLLQQLLLMVTVDLRQFLDIL